MSTLSPIDPGNGYQSGIASGGSGYDGGEPKRRGPKPDSKPALTFKQERNRQAQRTHRNRKETHVRRLEQHVEFLKEQYNNVQQERDVFAEDNRKLRELLQSCGIAVPGRELSGSQTYGGSSNGSMAGGYSAARLETPTSAGSAINSPGFPGSGLDGRIGPQQGLDIEAIGADFVLTLVSDICGSSSLEQPCKEHIPYLMARSHDSDGDIHGHSLMLTCPLESQVAAHPDVPLPRPAVAQLKGPMRILMEMSPGVRREYNVWDGEILPIEAWVMICEHPRFAELNKKDFETLRDDLATKYRCYG
ncbi:MAG: hypothetical protein M1827_007037 [Pycnora praestabilis]|nr:MAG: hypothetical protein M1827_007037 [Pycnora praestabilis]